MKDFRKTSITLAAILLLFLGMFGNAAAINSNAGTTVFNFLKINVGARPVAMGGAFTGVADDASALYYNPAGIASLKGKQFIAGYHNTIFDIQSGFLGYVHPIGQDKRLAIQASYLNYGDFIQTDANGVEEGTFSGGDIMFALSYGMQLGQHLDIGLTGKYIYEKIDAYSSGGIAFDVGLRYVIVEGRERFRGRYEENYIRNEGRIVAGVSIQNIGLQTSTFIENAEKEPLPTTFRLGGSAYPKGLPFMVAADIIVPTDNDITVALGVEMFELDPLFVRLGWTSFGSNYKTGSDKDGLSGFSAGLGFEFKTMQISYTISPQAELGTSHRVTFTGGLF